MKKIAFLACAMMMAIAVDAQVAVGLQGGYAFEHRTNSWNTDYWKSTVWLGGLQVGYQVTPKLYVGVMGGYLSHATDSLHQFDTLPTYVGVENVPIEDHRYQMSQAGWTVSPLLRYELFKYGNMHFHVMLQGTIRSMGYGTHTESYVTPTVNNREYIEPDPYEDSVKTFSWSVSLRPTLTYEFSKHLSAELSLDFLSVGYCASKTTYDATANPAHYHLDADGEKVQNVYYNKSFYGGLNTLMETLRWESPMLRLGFNYTF